MSQRPDASRIVPRRMDFDFDAEDIPVHWYEGNGVATVLSNGLDMVFPEGERFFIRSVRYFLPQIEDPSLRSRVKAFFQQEGHHGREHERAFRMLEAQGFEVESWLSWFKRDAFGPSERFLPPLLRLSVTVALEHLTASWGFVTLAEGRMAGVHPVMRDLLEWHSAEEIEHKSVAFDVYQAVGGGYLLRVLGMAVALVALVIYWRSATAHLARQDPALTSERWASDMDALRQSGRVSVYRELAGFALDYLRPGFHPDDRDDYHLAEAALGRLQTAAV